MFLKVEFLAELLAAIRTWSPDRLCMSENHVTLHVALGSGGLVAQHALILSLESHLDRLQELHDIHT